MKNSLVTKVIYRSVFCTVSLFSILLMTEFFSVGGSDTATFTKDLFYYYTNLSNFLCFGVMIVCLRDDAKQLRSGKLYGYNRSSILKYLKFSATIIISITFIAYGLLLGEPLTLKFWNNIANLGYHVVCPVLFILDSILFDEHKSVGILDALLATVLPIIYVVVIEIMGAQTGRYPYFFLDMGELGLGGLMMWIGILLSLFLVIGYGLFFYDKLVRINGKWKFDFSDTKLIGPREKSLSKQKHKNGGTTAGSPIFCLKNS